MTQDTRIRHKFEKSGVLLNLDSDRQIQAVFDEYASADEFQFNRAVIPIRLAQYGNEKLVSRSQANKLLTRVERFESIGQTFADEIFGIYASIRPNITLQPANVNSDVEKMVKRVTSNVSFSE